MSSHRILVAETRSPIEPAGFRRPFSHKPGEPSPGAGRSLRLPVGVVAWNAPSPSLTVIVKLTLTFGPGCEIDGEATWAELAPVQAPLAGTAMLAPGSSVLVHPTDFVPRKARADVLVTGHAYAPLRPSTAGLGATTTRIDAGFSVDELDRDFSLMARGLAEKVALDAEHFDDRGGTVSTDPVGPIASRRVLAPEPWHDESFDFMSYNAASELQRPRSIAPDALIRLRHLSPRAEERTILLPNLAPRVLWNARGFEQLAEIEMDCDTLLLDTDSETCTLLFRGTIAVESAAARVVSRLVVSLEHCARRRPVDDLVRELPRGMFFYARWPEDAEPQAAPPPESTAELTMARYASWGHARGPDPVIPLDLYAVICAELGEREEPRADTLRRHGLDEDDWTIEERAWSTTMATASADDDGALLVEFAQLLVAAQEGLGTPQENERTLADYARVLVAMERRDPARVLDAERMTLPVWMRLDRRFGGAARADTAVRAELDDLLARERGQAPTPALEG
ncbi:MAG: DUF2169 domain-containing protein [Byssovorax sp.]